MDYFNKCPKCGGYMTYTGGGASDRTFTGKVSGRNMVSNGIYGMIGKCGRYFVGEAIDKLAEYENAEEEGRLVVLPCKPWDKVYVLFIVDVIDKKPIYKIFQAKVTKITIDRFRVLFSFETLDENKYSSERTMEAFGETVFLTREEAKKALKEMEGNDCHH